MNTGLMFKRNACDISIVHEYTNTYFVGDKDKRRLISHLHYLWQCCI